MDQFTIITGTNRPNSNSEKIAEVYASLLHNAGGEGRILRLTELPRDFVFTDMWDERSSQMQAIIDEYMVPANKYIFIVPEYNGGFPGVLKAFIDCVPPKTFQGKKAGLVGLSSGKAGGLRPMDQLSNVMNYLKVSVLYAKPKLSEIEMLLSDNRLNDERANELLRQHVQLMLEF
jgi:NAD(P)H-dependent FMN reductase